MPDTDTKLMQAIKETVEKSYSLQDWQRGYESQPQEADYWLDDIEGVGIHSLFASPGGCKTFLLFL